MCWFIIDPKTGRSGEHVKNPSRGENLYLHNLAFDSFFEIGYAFHQFIAPYSRPPFEDLVAFVIDGETRDSFRHLPQAGLAEHQKAMRDFWAAWDAGEDGYPALLGRPMLREEKYWLLEHWLRRVAVGRKQFYKGKTVVREEWLYQWHHGPEREWTADCYGRLRVFSDGTADAWWGAGLFGYSDEAGARHELSGARYRPWEEIENQLFAGRFLPEPPPPSAFNMDDSDVPFRYEG
jgi:hypothetical protein